MVYKQLSYLMFLQSQWSEYSKYFQQCYTWHEMNVTDLKSMKILYINKFHLCLNNNYNMVSSYLQITWCLMSTGFLVCCPLSAAKLVRRTFLWSVLLLVPATHWLGPVCQLPPPTCTQPSQKPAARCRTQPCSSRKKTEPSSTTP